MRLEELENIRQALIKKRNRNIIINICLIASAILIVVKMLNYYKQSILVLACLMMVLNLFFINAFISVKNSPLFKKYVYLYKRCVVASVLSKVFTDVKYDPDRGIDYDFLANTNMIYMGDRFHSEDYVSGKYKNVSFFMSDIHIEHETTNTDSDGHTTTDYVTIFKGQWMVFDFNKEFKSNIQVAEKVHTFPPYMFSEIMYQRVEMESVEFNKRFAVFAENDHEAFYILTPKLMEKIIKLSDECSTKLLLCFINNQLHIGLNNYLDLFEPPDIRTPISEQKLSQDILKEIQNIIIFIDELELDNNLFMKE